jgi:hypothetical protein
MRRSIMLTTSCQWFAWQCYVIGLAFDHILVYLQSLLVLSLYANLFVYDFSILVHDTVGWNSSLL